MADVVIKINKESIFGLDDMIKAMVNDDPYGLITINRSGSYDGDRYKRRLMESYFKDLERFLDVAPFTIRHVNMGVTTRYNETDLISNGSFSSFDTLIDTRCFGLSAYHNRCRYLNVRYLITGESVENAYDGSDGALAYLATGIDESISQYSVNLGNRFLSSITDPVRLAKIDKIKERLHAMFRTDGQSGTIGGNIGFIDYLRAKGIIRDGHRDVLRKTSDYLGIADRYGLLSTDYSSLDALAQSQIQTGLVREVSKSLITAFEIESSSTLSALISSGTDALVAELIDVLCLMVIL